ncbi:hypothetical protein BH24ACT9_BH24ACT9_14140 [soil metagenome]
MGITLGPSQYAELGTHLDRSVVTGTSCRYEPAQPVTWTLKNTQRGAH